MKKRVILGAFFYGSLLSYLFADNFIRAKQFELFYEINDFSKIKKIHEIELIHISAGTVNCDEKCGNDNNSIVVNKDFYIGKYTITQKQWLELMGKPPFKDKSLWRGGDYPAYLVNWNDIVSSGGFLDTLNEKIGCQGLMGLGNERYEPKHYADGFPAGCFRLPTADESEYASRAGASTKYYWGESDDILVVDRYAWFRFSKDFSSYPLPVGKKLPNSWGLYDTIGNIMEWTCDKWHSTNPSFRIVRGGSISSYSKPVDDLRMDHRAGVPPDVRAWGRGFRVLMEID
jgi:formylglycine-generating enzyme required for sulfatase activity